MLKLSLQHSMFVKMDSALETATKAIYVILQFIEKRMKFFTEAEYVECLSAVVEIVCPEI